MKETTKGIFLIFGAICLSGFLAGMISLSVSHQFGSDRYISIYPTTIQQQTIEVVKEVVKEPTVTNNYPLPENVRDCMRIDNEEGFSIHCEVRK